MSTELKVYNVSKQYILFDTNERTKNGKPKKARACIGIVGSLLWGGRQCTIRYNFRSKCVSVVVPMFVKSKLPWGPTTKMHTETTQTYSLATLSSTRPILVDAVEQLFKLAE